MEENYQYYAFKFVVDDMMEDLTQRLDDVVDDLMIKLFDCFTEFERQKINTCSTSITKVKELLEILQTKQTDVHERFIDVLEKEFEYVELASELKQKWKKACEYYGSGPLCNVIVRAPTPPQDNSVFRQSFQYNEQYRYV